jgi:hypothetical protein
MVAFAPTAPWSVVFTFVSSTAIFTTASLAIFVAVASFVAFATMASSVVLTSVAITTITDATAEASLAVEVDLSPSDTLGAVDAAALRSGHGALVTAGA